MNPVPPDEVVAILARRFPGEEFRACPGHDGYYISDAGNAWTTWPPCYQSHPTETFTVGVITLRRLYQHRDKGYRQVAMRGLGRRCKISVHVLVLEAFKGPRPDGMEGCHNDGNPANNRADNLRWDTATANAADRARHGTCLTGERNGFAKLTEDKIRDAFRLRAEGLTTRAIAARLGIRQSHVSRILLGQTWAHVTGPLARTLPAR